MILIKFLNSLLTKDLKHLTIINGKLKSPIRPWQHLILI